MKLRAVLRLGTGLAALAWAAAAAAIETGKPAPPLQAKLLDGGAYALAQHQGEVVILNFWATWCVPCRAELPAFAEFYKRHQDEGLSVLAISVDDAEDLAKVHGVAKTLPFPAALYGETDAAAYGRIWRLPITFIIGRDGVLRYDGGKGELGTFDLPALERVAGPLLSPK